MKPDWQMKSIGEVCEVVNGGTPNTGVAEFWNGEFRWITPAEMGRRLSPYVGKTERQITEKGMSNSSARLMPPKSVILSSRAPIGHLVINTEPMAFNQGCKGLIPSRDLHYKYLYYYLFSRVDLLNSLGTGATFKELSGGKLKEVPIPIPPAAEQQRIVSVLDQTFEYIATATANVEKNLVNAKELFESHLRYVFTHTGSGWEIKTLGELCDFENGDRGVNYPSKSIQTTSGVPFINAGHLTEDGIDMKSMNFIPQERFSLLGAGKIQAEDILFCLRGSLGKCASVGNMTEGAIASSLVIIRPAAKLLNGFLLAYLRSHLCAEMIERFRGGAAQPNLSAQSLKQFVIAVPSLETQKAIMSELEALSAQTKKLESGYQQKLAALAELRKSILHQAFSGELTSANKAPTLVNFPPKIHKLMSPTDVHVGILALAYQKHTDKGNVVNFGHVKAEKIAHMLEAKLGVDLGREPVKDAAGPNDYPRLIKVKSRARKAGYFDFKQIDGASAYRVSKLSRFDEIIDKTREFLAEKMPAVNELLELMLPMDTQQAEIFSTVYAAWNNLLLDGLSPTDEAIVYEARENWHPDKLKIPRERFFAAIGWIRDKKIIPEGKGKKVLPKKIG